MCNSGSMASWLFPECPETLHSTEEKMTELKYKYVPSITLHITEEITTTKLCSSSSEGFEEQIANLVDVFLVEMYRCKLCQFTTSIKNKIKVHVSNIHELERIHLISASPRIGPDQEENDNYSIGDEIGQENKENEVNLEKMPFLLPMYRILNNMSPESCDISLGDHSDSTQVAHTCDVNTLFEEETSNFQLDEPSSIASNPNACSADASESRKSTDDEEAQSEHLMSLGLCRTSIIKSQTLGAETKVPVPELRWETNSNRQKDGAEQSSMSVAQKDNFRLRLRADRRKHVCNRCDCELKSKESYKTHMKCHNRDQGFKCLHCNCCMSDWSLMEKHIQTHVLANETYKCLVCKKEFMIRSAWKLHKKRHQEKMNVFQCSKCSTFYKSEQIRNLHFACHSEDHFKCPHCDFMDAEWKKVYKHLCTHDINPHRCTECDQRFFRVAELKEHMAKHNNSTSFLCSLCGQTFKCRRQLNKHHMRDHPKQNVFERKRRRKTRSSSLGHQDTEETIKTRRGSKEYACSDCSRKCSSKLALQRHMGVHAGVKPFHCQHCDYKTRLKASLIQHMRVHTGEKPFRCEMCSYASIDASSLRRHRRTHSSEKPYKCHVCSYSCIQKKNLDLHVRRHHTGEVFSCQFCQYSSPDKQLLQKHVRKYHLTLEKSSSDVQSPGDS
ncbi:oocyte zinc finger protein XlCOF6-like isoform X2 [Pleurodeles waltl]|uniref:oocyte zinc finger protein XlCOF6-like isoform X2 n=1 Tax=Pleurodeles waltl TaxID=8319 RepID=UPI003709581C